MKILLLGLGRANLGVAKYLIEQGDELYLYEEHPDILSRSAWELLETGRIRISREVKYDMAVSSPGFPPNKEIIKELMSNNIPIIDEVEFTYQHLNHPKIIAVTGTNGKSTTVSVINNILNAAKINNFLGGNISPGMPFSQTLFLPEFEYYILEISSFQLMRIKEFHPYIAVLTNISVDHLNWHSNFDEYKRAKSRIFKNQNGNDFAVLNYEDVNIRDFIENINAQIIYFGLDAKNGAHLNGNFFYKQEELFPVVKSGLPGQHNMMNILAAIAVAKLLNIDNERIEKGVTTFKTLPHRLENIGFMQGIQYINNSMCTNENAAIASFRAVKGMKIVIVGGKQKGDSAVNYLDLLTKEAKACVILGENVQDVADYFKGKKFDRFAVAEDMDDAVRKARTFAEVGDIILLNPGFASFDQFANFEERGDAFKDAVHRD